MANNSNNIEIRSEKVRNIIGQIPPRLIRSGISVISIVLVLIIICSYFFKYTYTIKSEAYFINSGNRLIGIVKIPAIQYVKIEKGQKVFVYFPMIPGMSTEMIICEIDSIPRTTYLSKKEAWFDVSLKIPDPLKTISGKQIEIKSKIFAEVEIQTKKISFFDRIILPVKLLFHKE